MALEKARWANGGDGGVALDVKSIVFPFKCEKVFVSLRCPKNSLALKQVKDRMKSVRGKKPYSEI